MKEVKKVWQPKEISFNNNGKLQRKNGTTCIYHCQENELFLHIYGCDRKGNSAVLSSATVFRTCVFLARNCYKISMTKFWKYECSQLLSSCSSWQFLAIQGEQIVGSSVRIAEVPLSGKQPLCYSSNPTNCSASSKMTQNYLPISLAIPK